MGANDCAFTRADGPYLNWKPPVLNRQRHPLAALHAFRLGNFIYRKKTLRGTDLAISMRRANQVLRAANMSSDYDNRKDFYEAQRSS